MVIKNSKNLRTLILSLLCKLIDVFLDELRVSGKFVYLARIFRLIHLLVGFLYSACTPVEFSLKTAFTFFAHGNTLLEVLFNRPLHFMRLKKVLDVNIFEDPVELDERHVVHLLSAVSHSFGAQT